jgi:hypothetical protein
VTVLYAIPPWVLLFAAIALGVAATLAGRIVIRHTFPSWDFVQHNNVAGFIIAVVGTLYAVSLAFVTGIVWQEYDISQARVGSEAAAAADVWHLAVGLPPPIGEHVRVEIAQYARIMIDREWPAMRHGTASNAGERVLTGAINEVSRFRPRDPGSATVQAEVLGHLTAMHDARRARLYDNNAGISPFQWVVLLIGALVVVGFCYLFGMSNERVLLMMLAAVAIIITATWVLVFELDYPFRGQLGVTPEPWVSFLQRLRQP